jgi:ABC-2 type transport system ATP-binding protein
VNEHIIELTDLTKQYGNYTAVDRLNLSIRKGEIFGLLGPNGAGKSTTILMMLGLTEPTSGTVRVCNWDATRYPIEVKKRAGYLPEDVGFYEDYTGFENIVYTAQLNGIGRSEAAQRAQQLLHRVGLAEAAHKKAGKYSRGMRQRLGLADVLIKNPQVIILDEPTLGIDPKGVQEFLSLIVQLSREEGLTVLLSSHHLEQIQAICDRVGLFVKGKLLAEGNLHTLAEDLFTGEPLTIHAGVSLPESALTLNELQRALQQIEGVLTANIQGNTFRIECIHDVTPQVARTIIMAGADLKYLNKKEYGLEDIYHHYFKEHESYA